MKRQIFVLLGLFVSVALFARGGSQNVPAAGGITEITHIVWDRGTIPPEQGTLMDNWWTKYIDEKIAPLGAKMRYVTIPRAQEAQILSTMLAANNAPDISKTNDASLLNTYMVGGGVADITEYVDRFGPNIKSLIGPEGLEYIKYSGKIYWFPHLSNGQMRATYIRKDWLDAVGMEVPATPDELYQVLKVIKEKDPGKRGASLIPFGMVMSGQNIFSEYEAIALMAFFKEPATPEKFLTPPPMWPEAKEAYRFLNKLQAEGLMTDTFIIDKDESLLRQNIARGDIFAFIASGNYPYQAAYGNLYDRVREIELNAVLSNIDTFRPSKDSPRNEYRPSNPMYGGYRWFIPATSKNIELTVKVLNFLCSEEGYLVGGLGIPGQDYTMVDSMPMPIDRDSYLARVPWIEPQYGLMAKPYPRAQDKALFLVNYVKQFNSDYHDQLRREVALHSDITAFPPMISAPTPASDRLTPVVNDFWANEIVKVVFAPSVNFDRMYDEAVREYKALGGDEIAEEALRLYAAQQGR